jgi:Tetratricopeptide repeat
VKARFCKLVFVVPFLACSLEFVSAASPTANNAVEAKSHYKKAEAAIANEDWKTAKSELIQASQLAPTNALVLYDLAIAYSHTGQTKSAILELEKALRLGLPATQQEAAKRLKTQLAANPTAVQSQRASQQDVMKPYAKLDVKYDRFTNKSTGSLTLGFPQQNLAINFFTACDGEDFSANWHNPVFQMQKGDGAWGMQASEAIFLADRATIHLPAQVIKPHGSAVPVYLLRDLSNASVLEGRFDGQEVTFSTEQIQSLREFTEKTRLQAVGPLWNLPATIDAVINYEDTLAVSPQIRHREFSAFGGSLNLFSIASTGRYQLRIMKTTTPLGELGLYPDINSLACFNGVKCIVTNIQVTESGKADQSLSPYSYDVLLNPFIAISLQAPVDQCSHVTDALIYGWYLSQFRSM